MTDQEPDWTQTALVPKFQNTEIAETVKYTWRIDDWESLQDREVSPTFEAGGFQWQLLLFPRGNPQRGCISLYLNAIGPAGTTSTKPWHVCAAFSLTMWNPQHPRVSIAQASNHRFTPRVSDWGYNEFAVLRSVFTKSSAHAEAPLIAATTSSGNNNNNLGVNITVHIDVLNDSTGVLWHDFTDYDSREETGYTGLVNQGATCYLNSLLQSLYFTRAFRNAVYKIPDSSGVTGGLQRLFYKLATSHPPVDTTDLTRTFGWDSADAFTQHDVQELARVLMDKLESKMKNTAVDGFLSKLFVGQMKSYIKCLNVPFESARTEDFWDIQLNVRGMPDVYASFRDYCATETLEGDNQYAAGEYGLQDAEKGVVFQSLPPVLHLQLKRYDYDWMRDIEVKINDHYEFPLELDLSEFVESPNGASGGGANGPWEYDLHGVLVHSGDLNAGHYYALIKPESEGGWYKFDDDRVTKASLHEVLDENFGSSEGPLLRRVTSAYMLVYIKRDAVSFVLPTDAEENKAPPAIAERIEAEKHAEELRQIALAEQQQYITLRVLSPANFCQHHRGPGILPWSTVPLDSINEHEEPRNLKVRIGTPLTQLARQLDAGSLWICQTPHTNQSGANVRARSRKLHSIPVSDTYAVEQLSEWVTHTSPVVFVGPPAAAAATAAAATATTDSKLVFLKKFDGTELTGYKVAWINMKIPLADALAEIGDNDTAVLLESSLPTNRKTDAIVAPLDVSKSGEELLIEPSDILILTERSMEKEVLVYFDTFTNRATLKLIPLYEDHDDVDDPVKNDNNNSDDDSDCDDNNGRRVADDCASTSDESGVKGALPEVSVEISLRDDADTVLRKVGSAIGCEPSMLQLRSYPSRWQRSVIIHSSGENISELWSKHATADSFKVLYRRLPVPLKQFEQMREVTLSWLPEGYMGQEQHRTVLGDPKDRLDIGGGSRNGANAGVTNGASNGASAGASASTGGEQQPTVIWVSQYGRRSKELIDPTLEDLANCQSQSLDVYAAPLPELEQRARALPDSRLCSCYHFSKEPLRSHGIPFQFALVPGEQFSATKARIYSLLRRAGDSDRSLEKIQFAVIKDRPYELRYVTDESIVLYDTIGSQDFLGLDHPDRRRSIYQQQAIHID